VRRPTRSRAGYNVTVPSLFVRRLPPPELTLFLDESGTDGRSPMTIMAGYLAHSEKWKSFSYEWTEELRVEPATESLHASQVYTVWKPLWPGLDRVERERRLERFAGIVNRAQLPGFTFMVENAARTELPDIPGCRVDNVLSWCFFTALKSIADFCEQLGLDRSRRIAVVCDHASSPKAERRLRAMFRSVQELGLKHQHRALARFQSLDFKDDSRWPPLQAADLLAWHVNRDFAAAAPESAAFALLLHSATVFSSTITTAHAVQMRETLARSIAERHAEWIRELEESLERARVPGRLHQM